MKPDVQKWKNEFEKAGFPIIYPTPEIMNCFDVGTNGFVRMWMRGNQIAIYPDELTGADIDALPILHEILDEAMRSVNIYKAHWSGEYPNLCTGEWSLYKNNVNVSRYIPKTLKSEHMNTFNIYQRIADYIDETFEDYEDGLKVDKWVKDNKFWLSKICDTEEDYKAVYQAFNREDFRPNSCGGCI